eukprot:4459043-Alexandrium_andersonii.AAC.1
MCHAVGHGLTLPLVASAARGRMGTSRAHGAPTWPLVEDLARPRLARRPDLLLSELLAMPSYRRCPALGRGL